MRWPSSFVLGFLLCLVVVVSAGAAADAVTDWHVTTNGHAFFKGDAGVVGLHAQKALGYVGISIRREGHALPAVAIATDAKHGQDATMQVVDSEGVVRHVDLVEFAKWWRTARRDSCQCRSACQCKPACPCQKECRQ